jgi:hypothetical protein
MVYNTINIKPGNYITSFRWYGCNYLNNITEGESRLSTEGPSSGVTSQYSVTPDRRALEMSKLSLYFSASCIPTNKSLLFILALSTLVQTVPENYSHTL